MVAKSLGRQSTDAPVPRKELHPDPRTRLDNIRIVPDTGVDQAGAGRDVRVEGLRSLLNPQTSDLTLSRLAARDLDAKDLCCLANTLLAFGGFRQLGFTNVLRVSGLCRVHRRPSKQGIPPVSPWVLAVTLLSLGFRV